MIGLQTRVNAALDWSEAALRLAVSEPVGLDLSALEAPAEKIVAEVAIFLREVSECPVADLRLRALSVARHLEPLARNPRVAAALALRPAVARDVSVGHVLLAAMGVTDSAFPAAWRDRLHRPLPVRANECLTESLNRIGWPHCRKAGDFKVRRSGERHWSPGLTCLAQTGMTFMA